MRILHPEVFQGSLSREEYFEGWYFKQVRADGTAALACIPGISLHGSDRHAFVQVIDGSSSSTWYVRYELSECSFTTEEFSVSIGPNTFSRAGMHLEIDRQGLSLHGELSFSGTVRYPASPAAPNIMGWYTYVPRMECNHAVVSADHHIRGMLTINGEPMDFTGGRGYIEKDWGTSFPSAWIWMQCNTFDTPDTSFMLSYARIPWMGSHFWGVIAFLYAGGFWYRFATYNGATFHSEEITDGHVSAVCARRQLRLHITADAERSGGLQAPVKGQMDRKIYESLSAQVQLRLEDLSTGSSREFTGSCAGLEISDMSR